MHMHIHNIISTIRMKVTFGRIQTLYKILNNYSLENYTYMNNNLLYIILYFHPYSVSYDFRIKNLLLLCITSIYFNIESSIMYQNFA